MFHTRNILIRKQVLHFLNISLIHAMSLTMTPWSNMFCLTKKRKVLNVLYLCEINRENTCLVLSSVIIYNTHTLM